MSTIHALRPLASPQRPPCEPASPAQDHFLARCRGINHRSVLGPGILGAELQRLSRDNTSRHAARRGRVGVDSRVVRSARTASRARATVAKGPSSSPGSANLPDHVSLPWGETKKSAEAGFWMTSCRPATDGAVAIKRHAVAIDESRTGLMRASWPGARVWTFFAGSKFTAQGFGEPVSASQPISQPPFSGNRSLAGPPRQGFARFSR